MIGDMVASCVEGVGDVRVRTVGTCEYNSEDFKPSFAGTPCVICNQTQSQRAIMRRARNSAGAVRSALAPLRPPLRTTTQ